MDYKNAFDIFLCGGSQHVAMLGPLLQKLIPFGTVHLGSSYLTDDDLRQLDGLYDVLHTPRHDPNAYFNFELFSIRDINRLATAPYFVKLDADIHLAPDWIGYVEECIAAHPDAVLFGPNRGNLDIAFEISGPAVRQLLHQDIHVKNGRKVIGGFYVGKTAFFKEHLRVMDLLHEFLWCYWEGVRRLPSPNPQYWPADSEVLRHPVKVIGGSDRIHGNEDTLRNLVVHAVGAGDRIQVLDSQGRVRIDRVHRAQAR